MLITNTSMFSLSEKEKEKFPQVSYRIFCRSNVNIAPNQQTDQGTQMFLFFFLSHTLSGAMRNFPKEQTAPAPHLSAGNWQTSMGLTQRAETQVGRSGCQDRLDVHQEEEMRGSDFRP
jgi:hypothetical protein